MEELKNDVIIVGAGVSGLNCARKLHQNGLNVFVAEGADAIGGRIRTDHVDGFLLDRGFQVLQTAYPEAEKSLDLKSLKLVNFDPGVIIYKKGKFNIIADPFRAPRYFLNTIFSSIGTIGDKLRVLRLYFSLQRYSLESIFSRPEIPTDQYLKNLGFSSDMINSFFRPFFSGVCLDPQIRASSRVFEFIFRMFASGEASIPEDGMGEIPNQIASCLPENCIGTRLRVSSLMENGVVLEDGRKLFSDFIVLATEAREVQRLLNEKQTTSYFSEKCLYFAADAPPFPNSMLLLNGEGEGPIINLTAPSQVSSKYAPPGQSLIAAVTIDSDTSDNEELLRRVTDQLRKWFGPVTEGWRHLKTYSIEKALPDQQPPQCNPFNTQPRIKNNVYVCGEYNSLPATQWALHTGSKTADAILSKRGIKTN